MAPFRNPFGKKPPTPNGFHTPEDENTRPTPTSDQASQRSSYATSRASSSVSIKNQKEPNEYKLSVIDDNNVYLPPSPTEKKSFWPSPQLGKNSNHRSMLNENEPFSISRESFESYRRSFDISARSPVTPQEGCTPRQSLDSKMLHSHRSAVNSSPFERPEPTDEERFEDIGLNDEAKQPQKKKGIFSRFGDNSEPPASGDAPRPSSSHRGFHLPGRKRGQSGQGAELGNIDRSAIKGEDDGAVR